MSEGFSDEVHLELCAHLSHAREHNQGKHTFGLGELLGKTGEDKPALLGMSSNEQETRYSIIITKRASVLNKSVSMV